METQRNALRYRTVALVTLASLLLNACVCNVWPRPRPTPTPTFTPRPTAPPYTPPPQGNVAPIVIQRTPARGEALAPEGSIELVFDRAMDRSSVEAALQVDPRVSGSIEWRDERTMTFQPEEALEREAEYLLTLSAEARAADGDTLDGAYRFRFQTVGYLEVSQVIPAPDAQDVSAQTAVAVMFNRPVVPLMAVSDPDYGDLPQPATFDPPIEGQGEWINTSIYRFTPEEAWAGGTVYTARIAAGLEDTTGGVLGEAYAWSFATQPPQVSWVSPNEGAELVGVDTDVEVQFNMPIDCASAREAFTLRTGRQTTSGTFACQGNSLTFTPTEQLAFGRTYSVEIQPDIQSAGGGERMRRAYAWRFTTVPLPRIVGTSPQDGTEDASPHTSFEIAFNAPIDPATVMPNLEMTPPLSPTQVYTYLNTWDNRFVLVFGAEPSTAYEVRIGPGIADPYGNTTGQSMRVNFRTAPLDPWAALHVPGMVGTLDGDQPAQVAASIINTPQLDLSLYRLEIDDFMEAQSDWWQYSPAEQPIRAWQRPVEAPLNQQRRVLLDLAEDGGSLEPGVYLLDMDAEGTESDRWWRRRLLVVSNYNVTTKKGPGELWAWVTDLATGEPVSGLSLSMRGNPGTRQLTTATTDDEGLASFETRSQDQYAYVLSQDPFILGGSGGDWSAGISPWEFGFEGGYRGRDYQAHVYTDRPLYRAGQTVHFRGIVRAEHDVAYSLPEQGEALVQIHSPTGEAVYRETLTLDAFGAFHGELALDTGAALGDYRIQVLGNDGTFQVAAYRPPEFEVTVEPERAELAAGQATSAHVDVSYFFGGAVADAAVEWRVLSAPYRFEPDQFGRYTFTDEDDPWICRWCWWREPTPPDVVLAGSDVADAQGQIDIQLPTDVMTGGQRLTIEATAYGKDRQAISGRSDVVVHKGQFYVGLASRQYIGQAGDQMAVDVVTVDWQGERLPDRPLDVAVYRREWVNTFIEGEAGGGHWEWEIEDTLVYYSDEIATDENAAGQITFTPEQGGSYRVVASGRDAQERLVQSSTWLWVSGSENVSWRRQNNDRLTLISDKSSYVPGETAEILIPSPFTGEQWAWITVERGGVLRQEVVHLENNTAVYRLLISEELAPNVFVSAVIVKGPDPENPVASHRVGYVPLAVEPVEQTLSIALTPSVEEARPGETVSFDVEARDADGRPVQAAFSLDLVDKAVLSLKPRQPDAIVNAFYAERPLGVETASGLVVSVNRLLQEEMEELMEEDSLPRDRGGGEQGVGGAEMEDAAMEAPAAAPSPSAARATKDGEREAPAIEVRETFADTAFWEATVVTDEQGRASVKIDLPDNLTTWVFRGVGATVDTVVGEETTELLVTKPLLVRPVTPRFFVVGDRAQLAALVSNNTGQSQEVAVTLEAGGLTLEDQPTQTVTIADGAEAELTWWVAVEDVAQAEVVITAVAGDYSDAARPRLTTGPEGTLLVHRYTAPEIVGTGGQLTSEDTRTEAIALPPRYDDRRGELSVQLDPSLAAGMRDGLDYLEHYPYECTEQIVSRFLPNVLTYRALQDLGLKDQKLEARLPGLIETALDKLEIRQRSDGGWGWWGKTDRESNPHLTAYVVFALGKTRETGFEVPTGMLSRGVNYLESTLVQARELHSYREANRQAFALYALAEAAPEAAIRSAVDDLHQRRDRLSHYGKAFLAMTMGLTNARDGRIDTLLSDLQNDVILSATGAHWEEETYGWWAMNTDTRSTAIILDALARLDPENGLIPNVVRWLMVARQDGIWETTQETAWALIALTDWMVVTGELKGNYDYALWLNDEVLAEGAVTPETVDQPIKAEVDVADLLAEASNRLTIGRGTGDGRLYYTAHLKVYLPVEEIEPLDRGVIVSRRYTDPACEDGLKCPALDEAAVGDVIRVRLTIIAPHDLYYVVVEDPLPAGAEPIDPSLATTSMVKQQPGLTREAESDLGYSFYRWWWQWYSRSEMRDDKVVLFADYLPAGTYEYTYTFRATHPGDYNVIPTTANEFYFPEVFGRGSGGRFTIKE